MAKYTFKINHVDETGEKSVYDFRAASLTRRQLTEALDDDDSENVLISMAFLGCKCDGEEMEDFDDLPMEVLTTALAKHPSFRDPNKNRNRRG